MIFYFSSTGNSRFVAQQLAEASDDRTQSILEASSVHLAPGEKLGFVFPTYFWRLPSIVDDFLKKLTITAQDPAPYIYFVATYGTTCGQTGTFVSRHLKKKGFSLSASFSVKMADDWTVWFDLSDREKVQKCLDAEGPQLEEVCSRIAAEEKGSFMKDTLPMIAVLGSGLFYDRARRTQHLHVEDPCIGCGLCARQCPTGTIEMEAGRPVWVKKSCAMCLHCLHSCPQFAIHYDNKTRDHGQYQHP